MYSAWVEWKDGTTIFREGKLTDLVRWLENLVRDNPNDIAFVSLDDMEEGEE